MIFLVTKDMFLYMGVENLKSNESLIRLNNLYELEKHNIDSSCKIVIDIYYNNVMTDGAVSLIQKIDVSRIIILAPFYISKINSCQKLLFVDRKENILNWIPLISDCVIRYKKPALKFSHNQFKIISYILNQKKKSDITSLLNITEQTLRSQKFNIMLKLKIRRINDLVNLKLSSYFNSQSD